MGHTSLHWGRKYVQAHTGCPSYFFDSTWSKVQIQSLSLRNQSRYFFHISGGISLTMVTTAEKQKKKNKKKSSSSLHLLKMWKLKTKAVTLLCSHLKEIVEVGVAVNTLCSCTLCRCKQTHLDVFLSLLCSETGAAVWFRIADTWRSGGFWIMFHS